MVDNYMQSILIAGYTVGYMYVLQPSKIKSLRHDCEGG